MRQGQRIWDTDTHCALTVDQLEPHLSPRLRELVPDLASRVRDVTIASSGEQLKPPYRQRYDVRAQVSAGWARQTRVLGEVEPRDVDRPAQKFTGERLPTTFAEHDTPLRLKDMDEEGSDVHLMVWSGGSYEAANPEVESELLQASHRCLADVCGVAPERLKSLIVVTPRSIKESIREIERWGGERWAVGIQPLLPLDYPIDHPDLEPLWDAAQDAGLALVHHSLWFGYPGYRDLWSNPFLGRSASHPWAAMRFIAAVVGAGIMERYPQLTVATLESGFGWLPFWARRMDAQADYVGYVNGDLKGKPSDYLTSGRFFCSIEMHEGPKALESVVSFLGEDIWMLGSDYPHPESNFPASNDTVLAWKSDAISEQLIRKLAWDNAVRCFGEP